MDEKKEKNEITVMSILLKLLDAIFEIFVGICKGFKYFMIAFPFVFVAFVVSLIFYNTQTIAALNTIKQFLSGL